MSSVVSHQIFPAIVINVKLNVTKYLRRTAPSLRVSVARADFSPGHHFVKIVTEASSVIILIKIVNILVTALTTPALATVSPCWTCVTELHGVALIMRSVMKT